MSGFHTRFIAESNFSVNTLAGTLVQRLYPLSRCLNIEKDLHKSIDMTAGK